MRVAPFHTARVTRVAPLVQRLDSLYRSLPMDATPREGKALIDATRPFTEEDPLTSWWVFGSSLVLMSAAFVGAFVIPFLPARVLASVLAGLLVIRFFICYHDHLHGALLRQSPLARGVFWVFGMLSMTTTQVWRETHNYHHAHTAKIIGSHVGSFMMATPAMYARMSRRERLLYRAIRNPLTIVFGYFTLFMYGMGIAPFLRAKKKHALSLVSVLLNWTLTALIIWKLGVLAFVLGMLLPLMITFSAGSYLFYAQHNFPDVHVQSRESWTYTRAALESSSYMKMGPVMRWFCGNIGYHHVHHLNSSIPFYRLPETMAAIPELQRPFETSWCPKDVIACLRLKLWDPTQGQMVGYPSRADTQERSEVTSAAK
jgi:omega-6 fatty acid desaturase (delta-12 desaturase)